MMRLALRHKGGRSVIEVPRDAALPELRARVAQETHISERRLHLKVGFPPKALPHDAVDSLGSLGVQSGDQIMAEEVDGLVWSSADVAADGDASDELVVVEPPLVEGGIVERHSVPADNQCLFTGMAFVLDKGQSANDMRQLVVDAVAADPVTHNEGILGRTNATYCEWMMMPSAWGGGIELSVFSKHYKTEICCFDIQTSRMHTFGEECGYKRRVFFLYDGLHYDPMVWLPQTGAPVDVCVTQFSVNDAVVVAKAAAVCQHYHEAKSFTDTSKFTLRCLDCQKGFQGQDGAVKHATATGHTNFSEA